MFCSKCGSRNADNAFKCIQCGTMMQVIPPPIFSNKKSNTPIVIIVIVVAFIFLIGILTAIAIPRFIAYRERTKNHGSLQLILDVKVDKAVENHIAQVADELQNDLRKKQIHFQELVPTDTTGINITLIRKEDENIFKNMVTKDYRDFDLRPGALKEKQKSFRLILRVQTKNEIKRLAYEQTLKTIQNRFLGVRGADIRRQNDTQILIQLPGIKDPQETNKLDQRGLLEFKLVDEENMIGDWETNIPSGSQVLSFKDFNEKGERPKILVKRRASLSGQNLKDARPNIDSQTNKMNISLEFDAVGAKKFERVTEENVGKRLAIVLDDLVYSAPIIQEKITGGYAVITGNFTDEEAKGLAIVLRAGALPVPVEVIEKRLLGLSPVVIK